MYTYLLFGFTYTNGTYSSTYRGSNKLNKLQVFIFECGFTVREYSREAEEEEEGKKRAREADSSHLRSPSLLLHFSFSLLVIHSPSRVTLSHY